MRGTHPNSQKNLKKFKEGESGNPSGRAKAFTGIKEELKEYVNQKHNIWVSSTHRDLVIKQIVEKAEDGDWKAIELLERLGCLESK